MENETSEPKRSFPTWAKIVFVIGSLGALFLLIALIGGWYLRGKLPAELKNLVHDKTNGIYELEFSKLRVNLIAGNIRLENVALKADTIKYEETGDSTSALYNLSADEFALRGIDVWHYVRTKEFHVRGFQLEGPEVLRIIMNGSEKPDSAEKEDLFSSIPAPLRGLHLSYIDVNNLSFSIGKIGQFHKKLSKLTGLTFRVEDLLLDSVAEVDTTRLWFSKRIEVDSRDMVYTSADTLYIFKLKRLAVSSQEQQVRIEGLQVIPTLEELAFSRKLGTEGDRYDITIPTITLNNIDFKALEANGRLLADSLVLNNGIVKIFNNKTLPETGKNKIKNAPHLALQRLDFPVHIGKLVLRDFTVSYREKSPVSNSTGNVLFTNLTGSVNNVTNDSAQLKEDSWARSHFEMDFLDRTRVQVDLNLNLADPEGEFNYKGSMAPSNVVNFNSLLQPMAMVKAKSGYINKLSFNIKANKDGASGTVDFQYKNLSVDLLIKDNSGNIGTRGLVSFLANEVVIIANNPEPGEAVRLPRVYHAHPSTRSFFNLMWKGIFEGIKETVSAVSQDAKARKEKEKAERQRDRKERRRQRRLERQSRR